MDPDPLSGTLGVRWDCILDAMVVRHTACTITFIHLWQCICLFITQAFSPQFVEKQMQICLIVLR